MRVTQVTKMVICAQCHGEIRIIERRVECLVCKLTHSIVPPFPQRRCTSCLYLTGYKCVVNPQTDIPYPSRNPKDPSCWFYIPRRSE